MIILYTNTFSARGANAKTAASAMSFSQSSQASALILKVDNLPEHNANQKLGSGI